MIIYWQTRSHTILTTVCESLEKAERRMTAVAWSLLPTGPWEMMSNCPVPTSKAWDEGPSARFASVPFEKIPR